MTAVELENKRTQLCQQLDELNKEIRKKKIEESLEEKGDILKDKWIKIGRLLFYSTGCISDAKAYDTREFIEGNYGNVISFYLLEFYGERLILHDDEGKLKVKFTDYDETQLSIESLNNKANGKIVRIKVSNTDISYYGLQIIDKSDLETINKIANEALFSDFDNLLYRLSDFNDTWKVTMNPNVKIELRNK